MVSSSDDVLDVIREQRRAYAPFTPLTEDEVKRAVHAIQDAIGEWGSDRLHAQWARLVLANTERNVRAVAAGAGDPQVHSADCNVTMGRRSADHRIHCDCTVAAGDRPPAPSDFAVALVARLIHAAWRDGMLAQDRDVADERMNWETLAERDRLLDQHIAQQVLCCLSGAVRPTPRAALTVETLAALLRECQVHFASYIGGDKPFVFQEGQPDKSGSDLAAAWLLPRLGAAEL